MEVPVARPAIGQEEIEAVTRVMESGMLASGAVVTEFEERFAEYCGTGHAVAVNSGTAALHVALFAAGVGPGDEVIVPSFSFIATATCVSMSGAVPVFADVDGRTFNIDPDTVADLITPRTAAVIGVHLFGQPFDAGALQEICEEHGLLLIEDAAQAHGAEYRGRKTGSIGDLGCFSFYPTKNMTTGEGGMITTDDASAAEKIRRIINHGRSGQYLHTTFGYNYRMTNIGAAIGLAQLGKLDAFNETRIRNAHYLDGHLAGTGLVTPFRAEGVKHVYHQYVVRVTDEFPLARPALMDYLEEHGIGSAVHYPLPIHRQPIYQAAAGDAVCPVSTLLSGEVLSLPVHPSLTRRDLEYLCTTVKEVV